MKRLSEREWTVLAALWKSGGAELGDVTELLYPETGWSRNTVHTYLTRMEAKGLVAIDKDAAPHIYRAAVTREACSAEERRSLLERFYQGDTGELVAAFLRETTITPEEREALKKLLDEMEV